jgi:uncharacterized membrane protein YccC
MSITNGIDAILKLLGIAALIEGVVSAFKVTSKWEWATMGIGVLLCLLIGANLFDLLEMPLTVPGVDWLGRVIGQVLTGVMVSRGADFLIALWGRVTEWDKSTREAK